MNPRLQIEMAEVRRREMAAEAAKFKKTPRHGLGDPPYEEDFASRPRRPGAIASRAPRSWSPRLSRVESVHPLGAPTTRLAHGPLPRQQTAPPADARATPYVPADVARVAQPHLLCRPIGEGRTCRRPRMLFGQARGRRIPVHSFCAGPVPFSENCHRKSPCFDVAGIVTATVDRHALLSSRIHTRRSCSARRRSSKCHSSCAVGRVVGFYFAFIGAGK